MISKKMRVSVHYPDTRIFLLSTKTREIPERCYRPFAALSVWEADAARFSSSFEAI